MHATSVAPHGGPVGAIERVHERRARMSRERALDAARASVVDAFERPDRDGVWGHTGGVYVWKTLKRADDARRSAFHARAVAKVREG